MASLNYKIGIGIEGRQCVVTIPRRTAPPEERKAFFYGFFTQAEVIEPSPLRGGHPGGQAATVLAVIEYEDGSVHKTMPENIRFLDSPAKFAEYVWGKDANEVEKSCDNCKYKRISTGDEPCRDCFRRSEWEQEGHTDREERK